MPIIYVVWGSTYLGIAIAIESMPPFLMARRSGSASRACCSSPGSCSGTRRAHPPTRRQLRDSFIVGGAVLGIGNGFVVLGEQTVPSGIAASSSR